jgi:RNA polymerase Rpb1, domain 5
MERFNLNEILLSDSYEGVKEQLKDRIITDLANNRLNFSNDYEPAENTFLKDEFVELVVEGETYEITYGNLLTLLIVARPFNENKVPMEEDILFDLSDLKAYGQYYTELLEKFGYSNEIKTSIKDIVSELAVVSGDMNVTFGNTVSIKSLIDLGKNVGRFRELLHYRFPKDENFEFNEIEAVIKRNLDEIMTILKETDNMMKYYIQSGAGVNAKQYGQVLSLIGSKPDLFGNIIPHPINTSFMRGLSVRDFYINALGARKALITNHQQVRNSGYLTRKISMLLMDTKLANVEDCGSHENNYMNINIDSKNTLKRYSKRFYLDNNVLKEIDVNDEDLIGQILKMPSPVSCASNEGICKKCYGKLFDINKDLNIGMIAVLILTDPLTQRLLSAKHLLETRSSKIEWGEKFEEFFVVNRNLVSPKSYTDTIIIKEDDYIEDDESEDEQVFRSFSVKVGSKVFAVNSPLKLFLTKSLASKIDEFYNVEETQYEIPLNNLDEGDNLAHFIMENNELSKPLREIKDLIETNKYIKEHTVNEAINYFIFLLNEAGIGIQSVHVELILREMMKLLNTNREQFKEEKMPAYEMLRITDANLKGESLSRALLFEQIKKQLTTLDYGTFNKTKSSILDRLL